MKDSKSKKDVTSESQYRLAISSANYPSYETGAIPLLRISAFSVFIKF